MNYEGDEAIISFQPVPQHEGKDSVESIVVGGTEETVEPKEDTPSLDGQKFREDQIWRRITFFKGNCIVTIQVQTGESSIYQRTARLIIESGIKQSAGILPAWWRFRFL